MPFDPHKHHRRSIRLKGHDYSQPGAYFVTICTYQHECLLGEIVGGAMILNACGQITRDEWFKTAQIRPNIQLHDEEFVIMPNHFHAIIWIIEPYVGATGSVALPHGPVAPTQYNHPRGPKSRSIGAIIGQFKTKTTKRINQLLDSPGTPFWQRDYFDRVIRDEAEWERIRSYILANPLQWDRDRYNPAL